jgi:hypothetical protein
LNAVLKTVKKVFAVLQLFGLFRPGNVADAALVGFD